MVTCGIWFYLTFCDFYLPLPLLDRKLYSDNIQLQIKGNSVSIILYF